MISDVDRYQGIVFRQLLLTAGRPLTIGTADETGRVDCFRVERSAFLIKFSRKRLSPWQFSFTVDQVSEIEELSRKFGSVWLMLVCGIDGVVGIRAAEFNGIIATPPGGVASIRVSRSRNSMYRISGNEKDLPYAKARGLEEFLREATQWASLATQ
jgi:hypothetical protein